jgi:histidine racemase
MNKYKYNIYKPGGNNTALVETLVLDKKLKRKINDAIMSVNPDVEQVGFIDINNRQLEMAGSEFCGNATRSAAFRILNGKSGTLKIQVSGVNSNLKVGIDENGNTWAKMPIYKDSDKIWFKDNMAIVELQGITQVVIPCTERFNNANLAKKEALAILDDLKFTSLSASGVMFCLNNNYFLEIQPVVWVRDIQTLFYETACASGTCAVGIVEALKNGNSISNMAVKQPSGNNLLISVNLEDGKLDNAVISGKIKVLKENLILKI